MWTQPINLACASGGSRPTNQDSKNTGMARETKTKNKKGFEEGDRVYMQMGEKWGGTADGLFLPGVTDTMEEIEGEAKCHTVVWSSLFSSLCQRV